MTLKEQIEKLDQLAKEVVELSGEFEAKKKQYRELFKEAIGIDTAEPVDLSKIIEAMKKALS